MTIQTKYDLDQLVYVIAKDSVSNTCDVIQVKILDITIRVTASKTHIDYSTIKGDYPEHRVYSSPEDICSFILGKFK